MQLGVIVAAACTALVRRNEWHSSLCAVLYIILPVTYLCIVLYQQPTCEAGPWLRVLSIVLM